MRWIRLLILDYRDSPIGRRYSNVTFTLDKRIRRTQLLERLFEVLGRQTLGSLDKAGGRKGGEADLTSNEAARVWLG